jgi:hypothetical protein
MGLGKLMPSDLRVVLSRRRDAKAQSDAHTTILLISVSICLIALVLLFASHGVAQAVEWMGEIEF